MVEPRPLSSKPTSEVPLPQATLVRFNAQARFRPVLTIRDPDKTSVFQESLSGTYPISSQNNVHSIELADNQTPNVRQGIVRRLTEQETGDPW